MRGLLRRLTVSRVVLLLPLTGILIAARLPIRDNSFLWHIRAGELQLDGGRVLTEDPFSFVALGEPWRTQSWLADLLYGYVEGLAPLAVGPWVTGVSATLFVGFVGLRAYRSVPSPLVAGVVALGAMWLGLGWFSPRPVVISLAVLAVLLVAADDARLHWTVPAVMWLWASIHGGFVVGLGYLVLRAISRRDRRMVPVIAASLVAVSLTAHGLGIWAILLDFLGSRAALDVIIEWATPDLFGLALMPFLGVLVALLVTAKRGGMPAADLWIVIPFLLFAFTASRAVPLSAVVLVPWIAPALEPLGRSVKGSEGSLVTGLVAVAVVVVPFVLPIDGGLDDTRFPLVAADHLTAERVFHGDGTGGYLIYEEHPGRLVYIDDRAELFQDRYVDFARARLGAPVWRDVFEEWEFEQVLLEKDVPLVQILTEAGWTERFSDETFVVLDRAG